MNDDTLYRETLRPQFHFTAKKHWINDPNGLVYFDGEYHLYFQHTPGSMVHGRTTWGHAVSTDLVHWKQLHTAALDVDDTGWMWSGSAAVDHENTGRVPGRGRPAPDRLLHGGRRKDVPR